MKEVNVIYWSSTGNTQAMAEAVGAGVEEAGGKANVMEVSAADVSMLKDTDSFALGASAMGDEELDAEMAVHASQYSRLAELTEEKEKVQAELDEKMERWMYLTELNEKIEAQK